MSAGNIIKPFWSWNDKLEKEELLRQIDVMKENGIDGFFMHARSGLVTEYLSDEWFELIEACIIRADELDMEAWAYDENGWPSGFADGKVPQIGFDFQQKTIDIKVIEDVSVLPERVLGFYQIKEGSGFKVLTDAKVGAVAIYCKVNEYYTDLMNGNAVDYFINQTHEKYYKRLSKYFGKAFKGFFTDEPQFSSNITPWTNRLPEIFFEEYGYSLIDNLPLLYYDFLGYEQFRLDFYGLVSKLFRENYLKKLYDWCTEHNCRLTGHIMGEDGLYSQLRTTGGAMACYQYFHEPGIDWLGRQICSPIVPKQLSSVARQLGRKTLTESFAMCGWNISLNELKWISQWQLVNGVTGFCPHLAAYSLRGYRKRDYPPSLFEQSPWFYEAGGYFNKYIKSVGDLLDAGIEEAPLLVIQPLESAQISYNPTNNEAIRRNDWIYADTMQQLSQNHILHHYGDNDIMSRYSNVENGCIKVGCCEYTAVLLPNTVTLNKNIYNLLLEFSNSGGKIFCLDKEPVLIGGKPFDNSCLNLIKVSSVGELKEQLSKYRFAKIMSDGTENPNIHYTKRILPNGEVVYYFVNLSKDLQNVNITLAEENIYVFDPVTEKYSKLEYSKENGTLSFNYSFFEYGSLFLKANVKDDLLEFNENKAVEIKLNSKVKLRTPVKNALTLDFCKYSIDGGEWQAECAVIVLQRKLLELKRPLKVKMQFSFVVKEGGLCNDLSLCVENPEKYIFKINGKSLNFLKNGYFIDKSISSCNISGYVAEGINTIEMECLFYQRSKVYDVLFTEGVYENERNKLTFDTELESIYLTGSFGVSTGDEYTYGDRNAIMAGHNFFITKQPKSVSKETITEEGFWFFAGTMDLCQNVQIEKCDNTNYILSLDNLTAPAAKVFVNGVEVGILAFAPYKLDVTEFLKDGNNEIDVRLLSGNRNLLGPHHKPMGESYAVCPDTFTDKNGWSDDHSQKPWTDNYSFLKFGF